MNELEKLSMLEEMLDLCKGALSGDTLLADIESWDSMAKISLIALMDENFQKKLTGAQIKEFNTIADILSEME